MALEEQFFSTAREREKIRLNRLDSLQRNLWTRDPIFKQWRFCNVHRQNDRTTEWFRANVSGPLSMVCRDGECVGSVSLLKVVEATVIFRWFNRIETGERILDLLLGQWDTQEAKRRLTGVSPVVTGAYIVKGPDGYTKLDGILKVIDLARPDLPRMVEGWGASLEDAWKDLCTVFYLGRFMAYELVSDLRWTPVLDQATDINTWANAGPGCARGLGWVTTGNPATFHYGSQKDQVVMLALMRDLLALSKQEKYWPSEWTPWEMREVEHWSCEYDKYKRAESGLRLKRRYPA
jgi:hypothetical protein